MFKGFSFKKTAADIQPKRENVGAQYKEESKVETITTFDGSVDINLRNLPKLDFGLDLEALKQQDEALQKLREERRRKAMAVDTDDPDKAASENKNIINLDTESKETGGKTTDQDAAAAILAELQNKDANGEINLLTNTAKLETIAPIMGLAKAAQVEKDNGAGAPAANSVVAAGGTGETSTTITNAENNIKTDENQKKEEEPEQDPKMKLKKSLFLNVKKPTTSASSSSRPILADKDKHTDKNASAKQSDMRQDDFENLPIQDFGLAYLRGLGYDPKKHHVQMVEQNAWKRKGLGLGAQDVLLPTDFLVVPAPPAAEEEKKKEKTVANGEQGKEADSTTFASNKRRRKSNDDAVNKTWLLPGLVVKVTDERMSAIYCKKGEVLTIDTSSSSGKIRASVKIKQNVYENISEKYLEPTLPIDAKQAKRIRTGNEKLEHSIVDVLEVDKDKDYVKIKYVNKDTGEKVKESVTLRDVCHFVVKDDRSK
ncbi:unnamed protein product [Amoebophrya sp. A120]|nr:unnamed protein product [Amoebophrya sp. A120]|eukprot:GSA120T00009864001.1